jgi:hypothetical protein
MAPSAFAQGGGTGQGQSLGIAQKGLVNVGAGVQAQLSNVLNNNDVCVAAVLAQCAA